MTLSTFDSSLNFLKIDLLLSCHLPLPSAEETCCFLFNKRVKSPHLVLVNFTQTVEGRMGLGVTILKCTYILIYILVSVEHSVLRQILNIIKSFRKQQPPPAQTWQRITDLNIVFSRKPKKEK